MTTYMDTASGNTYTAHSLEDAVIAFSLNAIPGPVHPATEPDGMMIWCATIYHKDTGNRVGQFIWPRREGETS